MLLIVSASWGGCWGDSCQLLSEITAKGKLDECHGGCTRKWWVRGDN